MYLRGGAYDAQDVTLLPRLRFRPENEEFEFEAEEDEEEEEAGACMAAQALARYRRGRAAEDTLGPRQHSSHSRLTVDSYARKWAGEGGVLWNATEGMGSASLRSDRSVVLHELEMGCVCPAFGPTFVYNVDCR